VPLISRNRAIAGLCAKWLENDLHRPRTTPTLAELLTEENVEAVAALNRSMTKTSQSVIGVRGSFSLGSKRGRRAGYSDEPGRDHISLRCELDTGYCGIMRRCSGSGLCLGESGLGGIPRHPDAAR